MSGQYRAITQGITVSVEPFYLDEESRPEQGRYVWAYMVEIKNDTDTPVHLRSRHWIIMDGQGRVEEVQGPGVVGEEPVIEPGEAYEYSSGCPLRTPSGIMSGSYGMEREDGSSFDVTIPAFSLDLPDVARSLN
ncbi:Co2+/Mg2+ efflux protein ApaG [Roseibium limicola]|uniref:Protein ApaG n=1 Tax=Roseibium limicola TaxID=2816037 RepID=A0A939EMS1_9HYPH|nr:Co2+/Mg2+ efflux protein ApaG [Roseibium limicola]